jgi:hypothetical protein
MSYLTWKNIKKKKQKPSKNPGLISCAGSPEDAGL